MRKLWCALVFLGVVYVSAGSSQAAADQAFLQDGSLIVGTVTQLADGALKLETSFGEVSIPAEQLAGLSTDGVFVARFNSGETMVGALYFADGAQAIALDEDERVSLNLGDVAAIWPQDQEPPAQPEETAASDGEPEPKVQWSGRAELGLNGQSGNKERFDVRGDINAERTTENTRLTLYLKGQYAETNSVRSTSEAMAGGRLEYDFSERTYVFGKIDFEYDEFEDLDLRTTVTTGLGHFFVKREKVELKGWAGAGYEHEIFDVEEESGGRIAPTTSIETAVREAVRLALQDEIVDFLYGREADDDNTSEVVVELGYNYRHDFHKNFRFKHGLTYYPSIDDPTRDYRLAADTSLEFPLGKDPDWTLRTGVRHEYDAMPQSDVDSLDTTYYLNLGYNF